MSAPTHLGADICFIYIKLVLLQVNYKTHNSSF